MQAHKKARPGHVANPHALQVFSNADLLRFILAYIDLSLNDLLGCKRICKTMAHAQPSCRNGIATSWIHLVFYDPRSIQKLVSKDFDMSSICSHHLSWAKLGQHMPATFYDWKNQNMPLVHLFNIAPQLIAMDLHVGQLRIPLVMFSSLLRLRLVVPESKDPYPLEMLTGSRSLTELVLCTNSHGDEHNKIPLNVAQEWRRGLPALHTLCLQGFYLEVPAMRCLDNIKTFASRSSFPLMLRLPPDFSLSGVWKIYLHVLDAFANLKHFIFHDTVSGSARAEDFKKTLTEQATAMNILVKFHDLVPSSLPFV